MSTASALVVFLLLLLLALMVAAVLMYYFTQQDLKNLSARLAALDAPKPPPSRTADTVRRERSAAFDGLVLLEAGLNDPGKDALSPEELTAFEDGRRAIKASNAELKRMKEWMGMPYDLEWPEVELRLPRLMALYRRAVEAALQENPG